MTDVAEARAQCASCGHPLTGDYCSRCGEESFDSSKLTLRHFLTHTVVHEILNLDGKIWRTLGLLLFRPGFLAQEYSAGRRRPYVNPVRVLIVAIVAYVLATGIGISFTLKLGPITLSTAPAATSPARSIDATLEQSDRFGVLERMFADRFGPVADASDDVRNRFNRSLNGFATPLSFATVLLVALTLYACFRRRRTLFVEHVVFSMQYYSVVLLSLLLVVLVMRLRLAGGAAMLALIMSVMVWHFVYLAVAIRRFYFAAGPRRLLAWVASAATAVLVYLLTSLYLTAVQFAGVAFAIARL